MELLVCHLEGPQLQSPPLELHRIKAEQERISRLLEASEINLGDTAERFEQLVKLIEQAPETYALTDDIGRRTLNQFFFDKIYIRDDEIDDTSHGDLINFVLDTDRPALLRQQATKMRQAADAKAWNDLVHELKKKEPETEMVPGSNIDYLVAGVGFEPTTFGL